jgi:cellulose biosynthesis protein BcsQ
MIPKLALLSGKGGSGKTTIALSLAKMLSDCGIKTLLIDCDIATNGATYFFETKLEKKEKYVSLSSLLRDDFTAYETDETLLQVDNNFWFIPSNTSFPNDSDALPYQNNQFISNIDYWHDHFDVIIFDCQAGYSRVLNTVLEASTINLVVLEPDAISSSSIRVLYAQVSELIEKVKTYQIFNKITEEEYSVYKQIVGGTTFSSLPPIKFNWEVRKAFAFAKVPEMVSTNVDFGKDVFTLANILFPALEKPLFDYTRKILTQEKEELELTIKKLETTKYTDVNRQRTFIRKSNKVISTMSMMLPLMLTLFTVFIFYGLENLSQIAILYFVTISITIVSLGITVYYRHSSREEDKQFYLKKLADYEYEYSKLSKRISEIDKTLLQDKNAEEISC